MSTQTENYEIRLHRTGGSGPNSKWTWEIVDAAGAVVKKGTALGEEHKAFATARKFKDKLSAA